MEGVDSTPQNTPGGDEGSYQPPSSEVTPLPEGTPEPPRAIYDFTFGYHCEHPVSYKSGHHLAPTYVRCDDPPPSDATPSTPPSTRTILRRAAATVRADGAGIHKLPPRVSYTNKHIPTIVNVTNPTQTHTVTLFGREVTVTFTAMKYEWNWGTAPPTRSQHHRDWHGKRASTPTTTHASSATTTRPHRGGVPCSMAPTPTKTARSR